MWSKMPATVCLVRIFLTGLSVSTLQAGGCASGLDGPTCHRQNVALNRQAEQSSTGEYKLPSNGTRIPFGAQYAVDGRVGNDLYTTPCAETEQGRSDPYWTVKLDRVYEVFGFRIYNRNDQSCSSGSWGDTCEHYCGHCWNNNSCSQKIGVCPRDVGGRTCKAGYYGTKCNIDSAEKAASMPTCMATDRVCGSDCIGQLFGISPRCKQNITQERRSKQTCSGRRWGVDCTQTCGYCWNNTACDRETGVCHGTQGNPRCIPGYLGQECRQKCGYCWNNTACDTETGVCHVTQGNPRCRPGYLGMECRQKCGYCWNNTACNTETGVCPLTEGNPRCNPGYLRDTCTQRVCPDLRYGPDCRYDCHCGPSVTCDPLSGCVGGPCSAGWDGDTCQRQNVALNRTAAQSSTWAFGGKTFPAEYAVDGKVGGDLFTTPCTHTAMWYPSAEWNVTLTEVTSVYRFRIYNRNTTDCRRPCGARLSNFTLSVGNSSSYNTCYQDKTTNPNGPGSVVNKVCDRGPQWGDQVRISLDTGEPLTLCEVQIFVCAPGWYGETCDKECNTTTQCLRCDSVRIQCIQCVPGSWGEDCEKICGNCWDKACLQINGTCIQTGDNPRCQAGYMGTDCFTNCSAGSYGPGCDNSCGYCAEGSLSCDMTSGDCPHRDNLPTCVPGYSGKRCDQACDETEWGVNCTHKCGHCWENTACDRATGACPVTEGNSRCSAGFMGEDCTQRCSKGTWGENCQLTCSVNCKLGPTGCDINGECIGGCQEGYKGTYCTVYEINLPTQVDYTPTIVGCVTAVVVAAFGLVLLIFFLRRYQRRPQNRTQGREDQYLERQENSVELKARDQEMAADNEGEMLEENTYETAFDRNYVNFDHYTRE